MGSQLKEKRGLFVAIEGSDGSGKATQVARLKQKLEQSGYLVEVIDFPRYNQESSYFVRRYLNGDYGSSESIGPFTPSLFYALDRFDAKEKIDQALSLNKIVIADRFVASNLAHQGQKFNDEVQKIAYWDWDQKLEFEMLSTPKPDLNLILTLPAEISLKLIEKRGEKKDIHESDPLHLERALKSYIELSKYRPDEFIRIECSRGGNLMSIDEIFNLVWNKIEPILPEPEVAVENIQEESLQENPYINKFNGKAEITEAGRAYLEKVVTDPSGNVYSFYPDKLSSQTIAAAMARLSRRADDMRITILDEFTEQSGKDEDLLRRVITQYGDDSVQQLTGIHMVVENASNLLTKKLEWGRLASYLEQSTRYIYFDEKDADGNYRYFTPENLDSTAKLKYRDAMNNIFDIYSDLVKKMTQYVRDNSTEPKQDGAWRAATKAQACDAIRYILPVSTKSTVGIFASAQALESLITHLIADDTKEANVVGKQLLDEARKIIPTFLERADRPERGGAQQAYMSTTKLNTKKQIETLSLKKLERDLNEINSGADLYDYYPKNELDVLPHIIHELSNLSLVEAKKQLENVDYQAKLNILNSYVGERLNRRHKPGRALETINYSWDIICDYGIFRDLQRHRMVEDLTWQNLNPFLGYDIPELVNQAGLENEYRQAFHISRELYLSLVDAGYQLEAQYATLMGHRLRWQISMNARQAFHFNELRTTPHGHPGYRKLVKQMHASMAEVHPNIAAAMKFVNQDEDPELTRLAAERASAWKMSQLEAN